MNNRLVLSSLVLLLIIIWIFISGCLMYGNEGANILSSDKYVALYEEFRETSNITEGIYVGPPMLALPPPEEYSVFDYSGSKGYGWYPKANESLKILYGTYYFHRTPERQWVDNLKVRGIYGYPYIMESNFTILDVYDNGTVYASYDNQSIFLKVGNEWTSHTTSRIINVSYMGYDSPTSTELKNLYYKAVVNTTWTVKNMGMYNKSNLKK